MRRICGCAVAAVVLAGVGAGLTVAQGPAAGMAQAPPLGTWPKVSVNVLAVGGKDNPYPQVDRAGFQLMEDGVPQAIQSVSGPGDAVSLGLLLDDSGSSFKHKEQIREAAVRLVEHLPAGSEVMVVSFADKSFLDLPFAPASEFGGGASLHQGGRGGTALYDAVVASEDYMVQNAHHERRALVLISDGGDNASTLSLDAARGRILLPGSAPVFALRLPCTACAMSENRHFSRAMELMVEPGGGLVFAAGQAKDIVPRAEEISKAIDGGYALTYSSTQTAIDKHLHKVEVKAGGGELKVHAMQGYFVARP